MKDIYLDFFRIPNYGKLWDTNDKYLETLFRVLSYEHIITAWKALLLEKKLFNFQMFLYTYTHLADVPSRTSGRKNRVCARVKSNKSIYMSNKKT